jgi:hypothetical protein
MIAAINRFSKAGKRIASWVQSVESLRYFRMNNGSIATPYIMQQAVI